MEKILRQEATSVKTSKQKAESGKWICPSCGREFKKKNQDHYCGEKPKTIDAYIEMQEPEYREDLYKIRQTIHTAIPEAEERISWSMPTYWKKRNLIHFAAFKKHIGLYPGPEAVEFFAEDLKNYKTEKGTIRVPYGKVDVELVAKIARWCFAQV